MKEFFRNNSLNAQNCCNNSHWGCDHNGNGGGNGSQMPDMPDMPDMPGMPNMPSMPGMPGMPSVPGMTGCMPDFEPVQPGEGPAGSVTPTLPGGEATGPAGGIQSPCNSCVIQHVGMAQAYVPYQEDFSVMSLEQSLACGTAFPVLSMPYQR